MWDFIINKELNKTIIDVNTNKIPLPVAKSKLDDLVKLTKENAPKGQKRQLKNNIFLVKKRFKL